MAFVTNLTLRPLMWSIWFIIGAIATIITATLARLECKKRRLETTIFASRNLKITSAISIGSGLMTTTFLCLELLPGSCILHYSACVIALTTQFVSMGLYQLSRLHYCFSKTSTHHQNGYSQWIITVMVMVVVAIQISYKMLFTLGHPLPSTCGFKRDFTFKWEFRDSAIMFDGDLEEQSIYFSRWFMMNSITVQLWDLTILLLYCHKVRTLKRTCTLRRDAVWRKIMFILQRIIIINVFYWISFMMLNAVRHNAQIFLPKLILIKYTVYNVIVALWSILYSISMYLMMEHNTDEYIRFLGCLKKFHLKYLCFCCCHRNVDRQLTEFESRTSDTKLEQTQLRIRKSITSTWFPNISENVKYSRKHTVNVNMSIPTVTLELEEKEWASN